MSTGFPQDFHIPGHLVPRARLCANCDTICLPHGCGGACPACTSEGSIALSKLLWPRRVAVGKAPLRKRKA